MVRKNWLLCALAVLVLAGVAYTAIRPVTAVAQDQYPDTAEGWAKLYEEKAQKCLEDAYRLNREIQTTRGEIIKSQGAPIMVLAWTWFVRDYRTACRDYHFYMTQARRARDDIPKPTPTPTPILPASSPDPRDPGRTPSPSGTGTKTIWPREENDRQIKFITEQKRKLRELKERADKLIKEANDLLNKAKSNKPKPPEPGYKTEFDATSGLLVVNFTTPHGVIRVYLPDDMRAGDTISGSVITEPNGQTEEERVRNLAALNGYQLMVESSDTKFPYSVDFDFPQHRGVLIKMPYSSPGVTVNLKDPARGVEVASAIIPVSTTRDNAKSPLTPTPNDFQLPTVGQNGSSVEIKGPFDGNLRTTDIKVGGQPVTKLAESPRSCIFTSPGQNFGPADITLKENNVEAKRTYRNLGVHLNAPKTSLLKGETTKVTIEVSGLAGIKQEVSLHLEARGVINMDGGNYQYLQIRQQEVTPDGRYTTTRAITAQQAGGFGVTATVIDPPRRPIIIPLTENARVNGFRVKKDGDKFVIEVEGVQSPITGKPVDGEHKLEHQCPTLSKIPYISRLFLNEGSGRSSVNCLMLMVTPRIIIQEEED